LAVKVQSAPFDPGEELNAFSKSAENAGAVVSFTGPMTERAIGAIVDEARARWSLADALVIHRYGSLRAGDTIMMVATASRHRADAFAAADFLMDYLKSRAPFWKKEVTAQGQDWVDSKADDEEALRRWDR